MEVEEGFAVNTDSYRVRTPMEFLIAKKNPARLIGSIHQNNGNH